MSGTEQAKREIVLDATEVHDVLSAAWFDRFGSRPDPRSICLLLAHVALETGFSKCENYNLGNVKAIVHRDPVTHALVSDHDFVTFRTWEVSPNGDNVPQDAHFRSFPTMAEGAAFYLGFLFGAFSSCWPAVRAGDPQMFALLLRQHGYYTASLADYTAGMVSRFHFFWMKWVQSSLAELGIECKVDGYGGPETAAAVAQFQIGANLPPSRVLDAETVTALIAQVAA